MKTNTRAWLAAALVLSVCASGNCPQAAVQAPLSAASAVRQHRPSKLFNDSRQLLAISRALGRRLPLAEPRATTTAAIVGWRR